MENGGDFPSQLPEALQSKVRTVVARAIAALGVPHGTVKVDVVVHEGEANVLELTPCLSGGFVLLQTGVDLVGAAIKIALGEQVTAEELTPKHARPVVQRYAFPKAGEVVSVSGVEDARRIAGVSDVLVTAKPGDIIPSCGRRAAVRRHGVDDWCVARRRVACGQRRARLPEVRHQVNAPYGADSAVDRNARTSAAD